MVTYFNRDEEYLANHKHRSYAYTLAKISLHNFFFRITETGLERAGACVYRDVGDEVSSATFVTVDHGNFFVRLFCIFLKFAPEMGSVFHPRSYLRFGFRNANELQYAKSQNSTSFLPNVRIICCNLEFSATLREKKETTSDRKWSKKSVYLYVINSGLRVYDVDQSLWKWGRCTMTNVTEVANEWKSINVEESNVKFI